jgi:argininosuccinate lyase
VFDAEDTLAGCLAVVRSVVGGLTLNRARAESAASGLLLATDVADYLVGRGVPFRRAHEIVGALVRKLIDEGREFESLSLDEWRAASDLFDADVIAVVSRRAVSVRLKRTPQSTAPAAVAARLAEVQAGWLDGSLLPPETSSATIAPPFALHFPRQRILEILDATAPASAW